MSSSRYLNTIPLQWLVYLGIFDCYTLACELDCCGEQYTIQGNSFPFSFLALFLHIALSFTYSNHLESVSQRNKDFNLVAHEPLTWIKKLHVSSNPMRERDRYPGYTTFNSNLLFFILPSPHNRAFV